MPDRSALAACSVGIAAELPVTMTALRPIVAGTVNGIGARFAADSGAFFSMLTQESAKKFNASPRALPPGFYITGTGGDQAVSLVAAKDFNLVGLHGGPLHDIEFLVGGNRFGAGADGIIGQNILGFADTEYDLANGIIRLVQNKNCTGKSLAYWSGSRPVVELPIEKRTSRQPHVLATVKLNGTKIRVIFDTGASTSMITKRAAASVGVKPEVSGTAAGSIHSAIGNGVIDTWIATFANLDFGDEQIQNTQLRIGNFDLSFADMLIGADFFLSHHVYVANSQHKLYFTYNGGPVFDLRVRNDNNNSQTTTQQPDEKAAPDKLDNTPKDAASFRRRGAAFASRGDYFDAIGDLDHAVELDPADAETYYERAVVRVRSRQLVLAMGDIDQTLRLKPDHVLALTLRGDLRLSSNDEPGASADFAEATRLAPHDAGVSLRIANAYERVGRYQDAIVRWDRWLIDYPGDDRTAEVLNNRCWCRAMLGASLDLALRDCDDAVRRVPRNSNFLNSRALVKYRRGDLDGAMTDYKASLELQPKNASSLYGLGLVEAKKGMKADSERDIQAATAARPNVADELRRAGVTP
jgi:tetratricopeptide (TPR) repeat protein